MADTTACKQAEEPLLKELKSIFGISFTEKNILIKDTHGSYSFRYDAVSDNDEIYVLISCSASLKAGQKNKLLADTYMLLRTNSNNTEDNKKLYLVFTNISTYNAFLKSEFKKIHYKVGVLYIELTEELKAKTSEACNNARDEMT